MMSSKRCYGVTKVGLRCHNRVIFGFLCNTHSYQGTNLERKLISQKDGCFLGYSLNHLLLLAGMSRLPRNWIAVRKDLDYNEFE